MKVFVLGHKGMLGHVVCRYLGERGHDVLTSDARYVGGSHDALVEAVRRSGAPWVVNALGKIWQKCRDPHALFLANGVLPHQTKAALAPGQKLLHASTDCVFSGKRGKYTVTDTPDAVDEYGVSKRLGELVAEVGKALVLRCSVIGPETHDRAGLLAWFLSQEGTVDGYSTHLWNGITTLEWAKIADEAITGKIPWREPIGQPGTREPITKESLLRLVSEVWKHPVSVRGAAPDRVDRTLVPTLVRPPLERQLRELHEWYYSRR